MFYDGKIYKVKKFSCGIEALYNLMVEQECRKIYDPVFEFKSTLGSLDKEERIAAINAFVANGRDAKFPEYIRLLVQNSLETVQFLARHLLEDVTVTEDNKSEILKGIMLHINDPEKEGIQEIKGMRNEMARLGKDG